MTRQWLIGLGYEVVGETDAGRAAALLEQRSFDALVSDVVMPGGMDGVALANAATKRWPQIAVVLVSGYADTLPGGGIDQYRLLDKPFGKSQLQASLRAALLQSRSGNISNPPRQAAA